LKEWQEGRSDNKREGEISFADNCGIMMEWLDRWNLVHG